MILCSGTLGALKFTDKARAAAAAGYDGISVYAREYEPGLRRILDDLGLSVAEVDGPMTWLPGQPGPDPARVLDIAADLGARSVTVLEVTGTAPDGIVEAYAELCDRAAPLGLVMHIEPFPWSGIPSLRAAAEIVIAAGRDNGGVLLDSWHLARGADGGILSHPETVVAVQVSDPAPSAWPSVRDECLHGRLPPGPFADSVLRQLPGVPVEVEVFADDLAGLDPVELARRVKPTRQAG